MTMIPTFRSKNEKAASISKFDQEIENITSQKQMLSTIRIPRKLIDFNQNMLPKAQYNKHKRSKSTILPR